MNALEYIKGGFKMMRHFSSTFWLIAIPLLIFNMGYHLLIERASLSFFESAMNPEYADAGSLFQYYGFLLIGALVTIIIASILAVGWHRRVLLDEQFHYSFQNMTSAPVWSYIRGAILIILILIGIYIAFAIGATIVFGVLGMILGGSDFGRILIAGLLVVIGVAFVAWLLVFAQRLSVALPSRAVERMESFRAALEATKGHFWFFLRLVLIVGILYIVLSTPEFIYLYSENGSPLFSLSQPTPLLLTLYSSAVNAFLGIFQVCILTLLYSHFFRKE